jgi:hypothetical protein
MFSLGIRALLDDLSKPIGPRRLISAYLDDIYILSNDPNAREDVPSILLSSPTFYSTQHGRRARRRRFRRQGRLGCSS